MKFLQTTFHPSWEPLFSTLQDELTVIDESLYMRVAEGECIFPPKDSIFKAFELTALERVKVVIVGQDPYHGVGEAQGFSFSVPDSVKRPPSLRNIFKELHEDIGCPLPATNDLSSWASQGVLLLNDTLTVAEDSPASHKKVGWSKITDAAISHINESSYNVVFILWGKFAESKAVLISEEKHLILRSAHPSPLSARRGFFGSAPFSKANAYLQKHGREEIQWALD